MSTSGQHVVLVDDDGVCLAMLARGLRRRGFRVTTYQDPREALERLCDDRPVAVVTDMRMPHLSGLDVVEGVQSRLGADAPPVLVVSADGEEEILTQAFQLGAVDYLLKPVSEVELGVKLEKALKARPPRADPEGLPAIEGWQLLECIGRGGTAAVYRAERTTGSETFALKRVWPHLVASTETMLRFRREIDTLAGLEHPGLIKFVESGRSGETFYYVMEHLPGGNLRDRIRTQGARPLPEVLGILERLADPLDHLHARSLVHRDVKPSNLLFRVEGGEEVVLADFGLARRLPDRGITLGDEFIGTPLYLAPEVFRTDRFDHSVDFYGLGVCAYEMLLGRPPLREPDTVRMISTLMRDGLPPPGAALDLAPAASGLLTGLLHDDPAARIASGADLRAAVLAARSEAGLS